MRRLWLLCAATLHLQSPPLVDIKYKNIAFLNFREGLGINFLYAPSFRVGIAFNYYGSRDEDDSDQLQGLSDIGVGVDVSTFGTISFGKFNTELKFAKTYLVIMMA